MSHATLVIVTIHGKGAATELRLIRGQKNNLAMAISDVRVEDAQTLVPQQRAGVRESPVCELLKMLERDGCIQPFAGPFGDLSPGEYRRLYTILGIAINRDQA